jgi:type II secretory pathway pseudopilin PulG
MSLVLIIVIVVAVLAVVLFIGGLIYSRRRLQDPGLEQRIRAADQALEQARANDRGWDRALLEEAARRTLAEQRPDFGGVDRLHLVLVDDRPGVEEDRAHMLAVGGEGQARVVLTRNPEGQWILDRIE